MKSQTMNFHFQMKSNENTRKKNFFIVINSVQLVTVAAIIICFQFIWMRFVIALVPSKRKRETSLSMNDFVTDYFTLSLFSVTLIT